MICPDCGQSECIIEKAEAAFNDFRSDVEALNEDNPPLDMLPAIDAYYAWWGKMQTEWTDPDGYVYQLPARIFEKPS